MYWELAEWQPGMPVCWHLKNGGPYPIGSIVEVGGVSNRAYECKAFTCNEMGEADYLYIGLITTSIDDAKAAVEGAHDVVEVAA
ncbi:MAG: hypothetical protein AAFZ74_01985 [Pseudomonadota bacterium]